jgi:hypothetical protein
MAMTVTTTTIATTLTLNMRMITTIKLLMIILIANIKLKQKNSVCQFFDSGSMRFLNCRIQKAENNEPRANTARITTTIQKLKHPQRDLFDGYGQSNFRQYI